MDQALLTMAEAAESGAELPGLCLFAGVLSVFGTPTSSAEAAVSMKRSMADAMFQSEKRRFGRGRGDTAAEAEQAAGAYLAQFGSGLINGSGALSLKEAEVVVTPTGEKLTVPIFRVDIESISSWFVGNFESSGASGGSVFGFVTFPAGGN
ncbi:MAG: hypothetical protein ABW065_00095 [Solirubrobacterales bacterium]